MVKIDGTEYDPKPLTLVQTREAAKADVNEADVLAIAWSTGADVDVVRAWFNTARAGDTQRVIKAVMDASGFGEDAQFPG